MARWFQFQNKTDPLVPIAGPSTVVAVPNSVSVPVQYETRLQYQAQSDPTSATQFISRFVGEWFEAWTPPPKPRLAPALAVALAVSGLFATPTQPQAETVTADKWLYAWSEPVRKLSGLPSYLQDVGTPDVTRFATLPIGAVPTAWEGPPSSSLLFQYQSSTQPTLTPSTEIITADKWLYPWSEPIRVKSGLGVVQQQTLVWSTFTPAVTTTIETSALSSPIFFKGRMIYQSRARPPILPTAETITADKWAYPWSEPVKERKLSAALNSAASVLVLDDETQIINQYESRWHYPWSEPVRVRYAQQQQLAWSTFTPTAVTVKIDWFQELSVLPAPKVVTSVATFNFMAVDNALTNYWLAPWPDFTYRKPSTFTAQQQAWFGPSRQPTAEVITEDKWHFAWSEPVRIKRLPVADMAPVRAQTIQPPTILVSQWFNPLSEPVRLKQGLGVQQQQSFAWGNFTPAAAVVPEDRWHQSWSEPVRFKPYLACLQQDSANAPIAPDLPGTGVSTASLSSPVFFKGRLIYQAYVKPLFPPAAEVITADKWLTSWSQPILPKIIVSEAAFGFAAVDEALTNFWYQPWPDFAYAKKPTFTAQQQFLAWSIFTPPPPPISEDQWHQAWSEPVRIKLGLPASQQQFFAQNIFPIPPAAISDVRWSIPWAEPIRTKQGLSAALQTVAADFPEFPTLPAGAITAQTSGSPVFWRGRFIYQAYAKPPFPPTAEVITADKWIYPWSEPVRIKLGLSVQLQQPLSEILTPPIVSLGYYGWLSEPVRFKRGLAPQLQQSFTTDTTVIPTSKIPSWLYGWSEPVRQKLGLGARFQQFTTPSTPIFPNLNRLIQWFAPFSEPVRIKQGLQAWLQSIFTAGTKPLPNAVDVTLDATETNNDTALFGISVYNRPISANVSIKEIPSADTAYASIEET